MHFFPIIFICAKLKLLKKHNKQTQNLLILKMWSANSSFEIALYVLKVKPFVALFPRVTVALVTAYSEKW